MKVYFSDGLHPIVRELKSLPQEACQVLIMDKMLCLNSWGNAEMRIVASKTIVMLEEQTSENEEPMLI